MSDRKWTGGARQGMRCWRETLLVWQGAGWLVSLRQRPCAAGGATRRRRPRFRVPFVFCLPSIRKSGVQSPQVLAHPSVLSYSMHFFFLSQNHKLSPDKNVHSYFWFEKDFYLKNRNPPIRRSGPTLLSSSCVFFFFFLKAQRGRFSTTLWWENRLQTLPT